MTVRYWNKSFENVLGKPITTGLKHNFVKLVIDIPRTAGNDKCLSFYD